MSAKWPTSIATDADLYVAVNSLQTTLSTALGTGDTSVVLASATGFPVAGGVTIGNEVIFYTGVSGATLTGCTRGADGTTAAAHSVGVPVGAAVIAFHHNGLMAEIEAIESYLDTVLGKGTAVTATEFTYLHGVTSAIQTQMNLKAALAGPTFTGTVTIPTPFTLGAVSVTATGTELNYVAGVTSAIQTQMNLKAALAGPTFTGTVTIPTPFTLGAVSVTATGTELNFVAGVSSAIQTQLNAKATDSLVVHLAGTESVTGAKDFSSATGNKFHGDASNTAVGAGYIGEVISSAVGSTAFPTSSTYGDLTSIILTAGKWLINAVVYETNNGATATSNFTMGVSTTSGNSATGLTIGDTQVFFIPSTTTSDSGADISGITVLLSGSTTYYLKYRGTFSTATPNGRGRITAVRIG